MYIIVSAVAEVVLQKCIISMEIPDSHDKRYEVIFDYGFVEDMSAQDNSDCSSTSDDQLE